MKTIDRLTGPVRLHLATGTSEDTFVMSADPLGLWLEGDTAFVPWSAIDRIEVTR